MCPKCGLCPCQAPAVWLAMYTEQSERLGFWLNYV